MGGGLKKSLTVKSEIHIMLEITPCEVSTIFPAFAGCYPL